MKKNRQIFGVVLALMLLGVFAVTKWQSGHDTQAHAKVTQTNNRVVGTNADGSYNIEFTIQPRLVDGASQTNK